MMAQLTMVRRGAVVAVVALLLGAVAVFVKSAPANADPKCTGRIEVLSTSERGTRVEAGFARGGRSNAYPGRSVEGTERSPIVWYSISADQAGYVDYFDLRNGRHLADKEVVLAGVYAIDRCHKAVLRVDQLSSPPSEWGI
jgi:hypothetical protein